VHYTISRRICVCQRYIVLFPKGRPIPVRTHQDHQTQQLRQLPRDKRQQGLRCCTFCTDFLNGHLVPLHTYSYHRRRFQSLSSAAIHTTSGPDVESFMPHNADGTELLNQLGDLPDKHGTNTTNTTDINSNNDDNKDIEERRILDLLTKEVEEDELTNNFGPIYLFIYILTG